MAWRSLNADELAALDELDRVKRFIERQCEIPDTPQKIIEVSLDDYNLKTNRIHQLAAEVQSNRQLQCADAATINAQTGTIQELKQALQSIANLWPDPGMCGEFVPEWVGPNDGRMRAELLFYAVTYARKALGLPTHPEPEYWHKKKTEREEE